MSKSVINNAAILEQTGLKVLHIRPNRVKWTGYNTQGMTIAYRPQQHPGHALEIATSVCSFNDTFCKKQGTLNAVNNFMNGHTVYVPDANREGAVLALKAMFG